MTLLTPDEVAKRLRCSKSMVYKLMDTDPDFIFCQLGRMRRIDEADLLRYIQRHKNGVSPPLRKSA
jgi:excisionase family DNA binding protein